MNYENLSKEELIKLLKENEECSGKYGLVWDKENVPEDIVLNCNKNIPVLKSSENDILNGEINNILIQGDNFHALSVLNYTHKEKINFIYIDPPYNTGHKDFIYNDNYVDEDDGYKHSKWLNMMSIRLKAAKELLKESGIICISIDDHEQANLKLLCDKIFGESNFICQMIWKSKSGGANDSVAIATDHEYVLSYAKSIGKIKISNDLELKPTTSYNQEDEHGKYSLDRLDKQNLGYHESLDFTIIGSDGKEYNVQHKDPQNKKARWRWGKDTVEERYNELVFKWPYVYTKNYEKNDGQKPRSILFDDRFGRTRTGSTDLKNVIGLQNIFNYPKPINLIAYLVSICCPKDGIILDFFAGSGTTGQAVLEQNKKDGGNRKFILCTNNENGICDDITYPRLKTVITGKKSDGSIYSNGINANLKCYECEFVENSNNRDQLYFDLTEKCIPMLCIKDNNYFEYKSTNEYKIFTNKEHTNYSCVYYSLFGNKEEEFINLLENLEGSKSIYKFALGDDIDLSQFKNVKDYSIEPIPYKIVELYKRIVKLSREED